MASTAQARQLVTEEVRISLEQALNDALSSCDEPLGASFLRLEASVVSAGSDTTHTKRQEQRLAPLVTIQIPLGHFDKSSKVSKVAQPSRPHREKTQHAQELQCAVEGDPPDSNPPPQKRRKVVGFLRPAPATTCTAPEPTREEDTQRRLTTDKVRQFSKRNVQKTNGQEKPSVFDRLVGGIWRQIHGDLELNPDDFARLWQGMQQPPVGSTEPSSPKDPVLPVVSSFAGLSKRCLHVTQASRSCRSMEVVVQARWVEAFDNQVQQRAKEEPDLSLTKARMLTLADASKDFGWSVKELRNKMAIWRGYDSIRQAGGWVALVFAGVGLYRFCKYRQEFTDQNMVTLKRLRLRFEVAADTIHPEWRNLLTIIGEDGPRAYDGHHCDWVVDADRKPVRLAKTYEQWTLDFQFEHVTECVLDTQAWASIDPRKELQGHQALMQRCCLCEKCKSIQSNDPSINECDCFPTLFGGGRQKNCPVQVFRTGNGRNNGLIACCPFDRGTGIGEFLGLITHSISSLDVMQTTGPGGTTYQIYQGRQGNFTRFVNHSCHPNAQYERFMWIGALKILLVSKGIGMGDEITVDYSNEYWNDLEKECLCGESSCRFKSRSAMSTPTTR